MNCIKTKLIHLSRNSKLLFPSFDITLDICQKRCDYFKSNLCYVKNNPRYMIFNRKKLLNNEKLLNSKNFIQVLKKEILLSNSRKIRFFAAGDLYEIDHLLKIEKLCELLPNVTFWLSTSADYILKEYYITKKPVKNLNIILSNPVINEDMPEFLKSFWNKKGIFISETTNEISLSNCQSSVNKTSCDLCENCFNKMNIKYYLHGTHAKKRLEKYEKSRKK